MRTTVTIDDRLLEATKILAAREHRSVGAVIEDALRGLLDRTERVVDDAGVADLPSYGDPAGELLVDILDKDALADALGEGRRPGRLVRDVRPRLPPFCRPHGHRTPA